MIEIPESITISQQAKEVLRGKVVSDVINATSPHRFTWYNGNPERYPELLIGKKIQDIVGYGSYVDICFDKNTHLAISDGTNIRYFTTTEKCPKKFQLLVVFDDSSYLVFTVAMYGGIYAFCGDFDNSYYRGSMEKLLPLDERFDFNFFEKMIHEVGKDISVKALLATEQRIPGLGNGVLQDLLFNAEINPRRRISTLSDKDRKRLFSSMKETLSNMTDKGGRDTEKDLFGNLGGYRCILSKNTYHEPCPRCGGLIVKEAYLGGSVYYCHKCQNEEKYK